jgi:hypothetical protein
VRGTLKTDPHIARCVPARVPHKPEMHLAGA